MKYLYWLITIPMTILVGIFIIGNQEKVYVLYWIYAEAVELPLYTVGIATLCVGFVFGALFVSLSFYALRHEHWKAKRRLVRLEAELLKYEQDSKEKTAEDLKQLNLTQRRIAS